MDELQSHRVGASPPRPGLQRRVEAHLTQARALSRSLCGLLLLLLCAVACARPPAPEAPPPIVEPEPPEVTRETALQPVPWEQLPLLIDNGDRPSLDLALSRSLGWLKRRPAGTTYVFGPREVAAERLILALERFRDWLAEDPSPETLAARIVQAFEVLESVGNDGDMLITGYYEPLIAGSRRRSREYNVPIYGPPGDIIRVDLGQFSERWAGQKTAGRLRGNRLVPYPDRQEIRTSGLNAPILAWARDPVDLFFIEVQGSGALQLPDGGEMRIGYAGANGRGYKSIGKLLIEEGKIERAKVSMQSIRAYLAANPDDMHRVLDYNPSVVFFRRLDGPPLGSLGVPVTPQRSIATDHNLFPRGALAFLVTDIPAMAEDGTTVAEGPLTRFVFNQDRGGAIRGAGRVDYFWGRGAEATERAGVMKQPGRLLFLVPKEGFDFG